MVRETQRERENIHFGEGLWLGTRRQLAHPGPLRSTPGVTSSNLLLPFLQSVLLLSSGFAKLGSSEQGVTLMHVAYSGWPLGTQRKDSQLGSTQCGEQ